MALKRLLLAALALACVAAPALAQDMVPANGTDQPRTGKPVLVVNPACNGGAGGYVGMTYGSGLCSLPGTGGGGGGSVAPFLQDGTGATLSASTTAAAVTLPGSAADTNIVVYNPSSSTGGAHIRIGTAGVTGVTTDTVVPPGASANFPRSNGNTTLSAIMDAGSATLQIWSGTGGQYTGFGGGGGGGAGGTVIAPLSPTLTNPTSTLTLPATTTAYAANQLIASSATAGSVVVPSFSIANAGGGASIPRVRLSTNDTTSTAWGGVQVQVDLWSAAPTFTNGDRGTFFPATGTANHFATYICTVSAEYGDGAWAECGVSPGGALIKLASGTSVFWTLQTVSASGVTGASKIWTLTAELGN